MIVIATVGGLQATIQQSWARQLHPWLLWTASVHTDTRCA